MRRVMASPSMIMPAMVMLATIMPAFGFVSEAIAQSVSADTEKPADQGLQEIVITAQRRSESIEKAPLAISAVTGETLLNQGVVNLQDAISLMPSVQIQASNLGSGFYIRGIGSRIPGVFGDGSGSPVSTYSDNVFQSRSEITNLMFLDVDRIEVLRGPQGTLYGRNNNAGAVNIISNDPELGKLSATATLQYGNYNEQHTEGTANIPINDFVAVRAAFGSEYHSGYLSNGLDDADTQSGRLKILIQPSDALRILLAGDYTHGGGLGVGNVDIPTSGRSSPWQAPGYAALDFPPGSGNFVCGGAGTGPCTPSQDTKNYDVHAQVDWNLGWGVMTFLPAYQDYRSQYQQVFSALYEDNTTPLRQSSAELRLASEAESAVKWVGGLYWLRDNGSGLYDHNFSFNSTIENSVNINQTKAVFGQVTVPVTDRVRLTGGLRYTDDYFKTVQTTSGVFENASASFDKTTFKAGIEMDLTPNSLLYADVSNGFRQGGVGQSANTGTIYTFGPETILAYELGLKNKFMDGTVLFNADLYYYHYNGYQLDVNFYPNPNSEVYETKTSNLPGTTQVGGAEFEGAWLATKADRIDFTATYEYTRFADASVALGASSTDLTDLGGRELPRAPKWTGTLGYGHTWELPAGTLTGHVDGQYSSSYVVDLLYFTYANPSLFTQGAYGLLNANLTWTSTDGRWSAGMYGRNLTNKAVLQQANPAGPVNVVGVIGDPRTFGVRITAKF
jgi:iron complex outermembrane recepter protein